MSKFGDYLREHKNERMAVWFIIAIIIIILFYKCYQWAEVQNNAKIAQLNEAKYQEGIELINQGDWEKATVAFVILQDKNYSESKVLYNYASAQKHAKEGNDFASISMAEHYMKSVPDTYDGPFKEDILKFKAECAEKDKIATEDHNQKIKEAEEANKIKPGSRKVRMGMSTYEAELSMGKPYDINRTTSKYGTHEQWCYKGGVYLYFDNDVLTSWQD